jgi:hypothetical protein
LPNRAPGWQPGVHGWESWIAGHPLPCCRKAGRSAKTLIYCGAQPCGSAPMTMVRARLRTNRVPDAGMIPQNPALPTRDPGGANHPHPSSNPIVAWTECPRTCLPAPCPSYCSQSYGHCQVDAEAVATARFRRLAKPPALVQGRQQRATGGPGAGCCVGGSNSPCADDSACWPGASAEPSSKSWNGYVGSLPM